MLQFLDRIPNRKFRMHNFLSPQKENSEVLRDILLSLIPQHFDLTLFISS